MLSQLRPFVLALTFLTVLLTPAIGRTDDACVSGHGRPYLSDFTGGVGVGSLFYSAPEGSPAVATIRSSPSCFDDPTQGETVVQADYVTDPGTATDPTDYADRDGRTGNLCNDQHPQGCDGTPPASPSESVHVTTVSDGTPEAAVESFRFRVTGSVTVLGNPAGGVDQPSNVPVYLIDTDGAPRAALEPGTSYSRSESFTGIKIPLFLGGPTPGAVGYSVQPGGASPATPGEDYSVLSPNPLPVDGSRVGFIDISIVNDKIGEGPESVVISLTGAVDGPSSTTFTILDNEESERPSSRFHHPRDNWRYKKSDYRIREVHVFATDTGGAGVVASQLALRRNMKNGDCVWLTKEGWQKKDCSNRQWLTMTFDDTGDLFYYRLSQLKSSVRTKIVDYTAFSRAIDGAENVEANFDQKRNANTFEIKRTRRRR